MPVFDNRAKVHFGLGAIEIVGGYGDSVAGWRLRNRLRLGRTRHELTLLPSPGQWNKLQTIASSFSPDSQTYFCGSGLVLEKL
jgi:hypothetical protein